MINRTQNCQSEDTDFLCDEIYKLGVEVVKDVNNRLKNARSANKDSTYTFVSRLLTEYDLLCSAFQTVMDCNPLVKCGCLILTADTNSFLGLFLALLTQMLSVVNCQEMELLMFCDRCFLPPPRSTFKRNVS